VIALVGNKSDIAALTGYKRKVTKEQAEKFALENNLVWVGESSAQKNTNVKELFDILLEEIYKVQSKLIADGKK